MSERLKNFIEMAFNLRRSLKEISVTRDFWNELQAYIHNTPEFHTTYVIYIHDNPGYIYVFGIKIIKGVD